MSFKHLAGAVLVSTLTATTAFGQSNDVKGWTPKKPGVDTPAPGGDNGPKSISRGAGDTPPQPRVPDAPPAGPGGPAGPAMPAAGDYLMADDAQAIADAMRDAGYRAEMSTDEDGNPKIIGSASRSTYWVLFLDCDSSVGCLAVEFYLSYDIQPVPSLEQMNQFNNDYRYIRASVNQWDQPTMYMDVLMRDGGISKDAFLEYVRLWHAIVPEFEKTINF